MSQRYRFTRRTCLGGPLIGLMLMVACARPFPPQCPATIQVKEKQQVGEARELITAQLKAMADIDSAAALVALAEAYENHEKTDEAYKAYAAALRIDPQALGSAAEVHFTSTGWRLLKDLSNDEPWGTVGDEFKTRKDLKRAAKCYVQALLLDSDDSEWIRKLGAIAKSNPEATASSLALLRQREPLAAAGVLFKMGHPRKAMKVFVSMAETNVGSSTLRSMRRLLSKHPELVELLEQPARRSTNDEFVGFYANALRKAGRAEEACTQFKRALQLDPHDSQWKRKFRECEQKPTETKIQGM